MTKDKNTPSTEVDQKQLLNDKVKALRNNNYDNGHIRKVTQNGAQGE